jgi:DnaK suppressor protein
MPDTYAPFRKLLEERRREILEQLDRLAEAVTEVRLARSESADDEHDPEGTPLSAEWSNLTGLRAAAAADLQAADAALRRIDDGTYGVCVRCGEPIGEARLKARPIAETCINCAL